jgi:hypothetical protein
LLANHLVFRFRNLRLPSRWLETPVANLVRHAQSGNHYARSRVRGKLIWKSLKTDRISVAKLHLVIFIKRNVNAPTRTGLLRETR